MSYHDRVFWFVFFCLLGILGASTTSLYDLKSGLFFIFAVSVILLLLFNRKKIHATLALALFFGGIYYYIHDARYQKFLTAPLYEEIVFQAQILRIDEKEDYKRLTLDLKSHRGKVIVNVSPYQDARYNQEITVTGKLEPITGDAKHYFEKEGVHAALKNPKNIQTRTTPNGFNFKAALFSFREKIVASVSRVLPSPHSNFVAGLLIGKSGGFSKSFLEAMQKTGTTHLIALSGYNITIIATYIINGAIYFTKRQNAFYITLLAITLFVIMTGAEASVTRAAIMGSIVLLADHSRKMYTPRNTIALTGLIMALWNPKILAFDVGFQLSFFALLGILYLKPALEKLLALNREPSFFDWKENLLTTIAAQIAVLPIILKAFGFVSAISLLTNVLVLTLTPYTMLIGLLLVILNSISTFGALIFAALVKPLIDYQIWVITFFSNYSFGVTVQTVPIIALALYYFGLLWFVKKYGT